MKRRNRRWRLQLVFDKCHSMCGKCGRERGMLSMSERLLFSKWYSNFFTEGVREVSQLLAAVENNPRAKDENVPL